MWEEALTSCRKNDGDLVSIHNMEEHSFIVSQLGYSEYSYMAAFCMYSLLKCSSDLILVLVLTMALTQTSA